MLAFIQWQTVFLSCRLRFGSNNLYVYKNPEEEAKLIQKGTILRNIDYEFAQEEIAQQAGFIISEGKIRKTYKHKLWYVYTELYYDRNKVFLSLFTS